MNQLMDIIKNEIGSFDHSSTVDSYIIASRIKKVLKERGYVLVENMKDAEDYFAKKYKQPEQIYEIDEHGFNMTMANVGYNINLYRYFYNADRIYSVLVTEL